jgi:hypothetical protein
VRTDEELVLQEWLGPSDVNLDLALASIAAEVAGDLTRGIDLRQQLVASTAGISNPGSVAAEAVVAHDGRSAAYDDLLHHWTVSLRSLRVIG